MKLDLYEKIICEYEDLRKKYGVNQMKTIVNQLTIKFGDEQINYSTIYSLVNYEYRKEAKGWQNQSLKTNWPEIMAEWNANGNIIQLADKYELCAYNLLRQVVNEFCESKELAKKWLKDPSLCDDGKLANEIMIMNAHDIMDGLFYNQLSMSSGIAFEMEVRTLLDQRRISYMSEDELRSRSYDVTPDFRLNIPLIVIQTQSQTLLYQSDDDNIPEKVDGEKERLVVTWIECKALFASLECHCEYYENQFYSYINRFGNGLILYKFGFVKIFL
ncbi:hypothetical protein RDWZM_005896 [Blomia tropicalis]|uniref:CDAN1-interacting nuclease 1 n=1 Tax=Blomia tropicalis TaxID=40697 RepID=A0A9Q0M6V7_BLOTA|nr:hypothetical protein RDWZM_005896 [Blomia tropicalis]